MATSKHIVVTGATGNIGSRLVHHLLERGHRVTAVARSAEKLQPLQAAGAEIQVGDLANTAFITDVLRPADAAFLMTPPSLQAPDFLAYQAGVGESIAQAVRTAGLKQAVHLSSIGADLPAGTGPVVGVHHQEARLNAIEGLHVVHLRPAYFMENLLANLPLIQHMGIIGSAMRPDLSFPMIATQDIAVRAADAFEADLPNHSAHLLLGPRNYTMTEATRAIGQAIGKPELPYVPFSYEDAKKGMLQGGLSESMAGLYEEMIRNMNEEKVMVHEQRTPENTTPTTIEEFAAQVFAPIYQHVSSAQPVA
ncbi:SDR family NAD(P)-dependent oxidoreductase [Hymenobacter sp. BT188]|uniref:SDR family NAD(P)-dependent oxidoreductase n=1 Tax=Hymenobacter sp. BT188 TaxID=2763504 RepID=UPI00165115FB|nr:SDR family NAD(P)-dependent oxidoreductase [Hymenobacter sp. BT188]MBC6608665.1 SDR family NAD(P)-dependent oxidoreductase [Hymenobacter sp. BT188]